MTNLERLYISFVYNTLNNTQIDNLANAVTNLNKLTSLEFIIAHNGVNAEGTEAISNMITKLSPKLTNFGLSLFANQI
jgi:hypothetical protein